MIRPPDPLTVPAGCAALVSMPWASISRPSLGLAVLKRGLNRRGFKAEIQYLNLRFASRIGLRAYEAIVGADVLFPEWFFSSVLFGNSRLDEMRIPWEAVCSLFPARKLLDLLAPLTPEPETFCRDLVTEHIPRFVDDCLAQTDWGQYAVVGFTATFAQSVSSLLLAYEIKRRWPTVKIAFGGASVRLPMGLEFLRAFEWIDYVVHGDAEESFPALLDNLISGRADAGIDGVSVRCGRQILPATRDSFLEDLNTSPPPDYSDYFAEVDRLGLRKRLDVTLSFETSRGCWWATKRRCAFCGLNGHATTYRRKSPDRAYSEILEISREHRCLKLAACDNVIPPDSFRLLLPRLAKAGYDLRLFWEVRPHLSSGDLRLLFDSGVRTIQAGIESLSPSVLRLVNKGVTVAQNIQLLKRCRELGMSVAWNLLYGLPGEDVDNYRRLPGLMSELSHLQPPAWCGPVEFQRFSNYVNDPGAYGLLLKPVDLYSLIYPSRRVSVEEIAFYFERRGARRTPASYERELQEAWTMWNLAWTGGRVSCFFLKGTDDLTIYDTRVAPHEAGGTSSDRCRQIHLDGLLARIYLYCDEVRALDSIVEMTRQHGCGSVREVSGWLDLLIGQRLMYREEDRYLSVAVRGRPSHGARAAERG